MLSHAKHAKFCIVETVKTERRLTYKVGKLKVFFTDLCTQFLKLLIINEKLTRTDFMVV